MAAASIFLFVLDSGFIGFALPAIRDEHVDVPLTTISWAATGFLVAVASLLLLGGRLADRHGRKRVYLTGLVWFGVASMITSIAPNVPLLITADRLGNAAIPTITGGVVVIASALLLSALD